MLDTTPHIETISVLNVPDMIHIGYELNDYLARDLICFNHDIVVITDKNIAPLYLDRLLSSLETHGKRVLECIIIPGEQSKSRNMKAAIEDFLLENACTRDTCLVALGGGVIGDLVGYVASTFMRGIPYIQVPTTLLAMVDSSIGGKTAIDTPHGKNLIGTFWQPRRIYIDLSVLKTLPKRELANGMAEVIKTAAISSEQEFMKLETGQQKIESFFTNNSQDPQEELESRELLQGIIGASVRFKANVVTLDEKESGLRGLLNFGHTFGHAYERVLFPDWLHGECVSMGILHETELSVALGHCSRDILDRIENCLNLYNLPTEFPEDARKKLSVETLMKIMKVDKKNKGSQKRVVLLKELGEPLEQKASDVSDKDIQKVLSRYIQNDVQTLKKHPRLPVSINLVAVENYHVDLIIQISQAIKDKYNLIEAISNNNKILHVSTKSDKRIRINVTTMPGSSVTLNKKRTEYEYVVLPESNNDQIVQDILHFIDNITRPSTRHVTPDSNEYSTFITPTLDKFDGVFPHIFKKWIEDTNAVEFRVDLLTVPSDMLEDWIITAGTQLYYLRQLTHMPIIFTVRTFPQAGKFDPTYQTTYYKLIEWAHRWGCEYIDVELSTLYPTKLDKLMQFSQLYASKWIVSYHDPHHLISWSDNAMKKMYSQASQLFSKFNHEGVIKLVGFAESFEDNLELERFRKQIDPFGNKPVILINMGGIGKFSRVANRFLTPATHPDLPCPAAPGQLSVKQLVQIRKDLDMK